MKLTDFRAGLSEEQVRELQIEFGRNELNQAHKNTLFNIIKESLREPMFLLLIAAAVIYVIIGEGVDSLLIFTSIVAIIFIDIFQNYKTDKSLEKLRDLAAPQVKVVRDGVEKTILSAELVPGDVIIIQEGLKIPADVIVVDGNDLKVDESTLTGEPEGVWKEAIGEGADSLEDSVLRAKHYCYAGTSAIQGSARVVVDKIGGQTEYGKIGAGLTETEILVTPLQQQTKQLIRFSAWVAFILFILVTAVTYFNLDELLLKERLTSSLISGITMAIAMIPEEFPVILTVFLSMGAWRLAQKQALVRKVSAVETLGAVSVLCVDKTGTLTMNKMRVDKVWAPVYEEEGFARVLGMACEKEAYDPMEQALLSYCESAGVAHEEIFRGEMVRDYAFTNQLKMMGHAWRLDGEVVVAVKGSVESVVKLCDLSKEQLAAVEQRDAELARQGLRVLAVATAVYKNKSALPAEITSLKLEFCGLVALVDPLRKGIQDYIKKCQQAGVRVVMITGDNGVTAQSIARQAGIKCRGGAITGKMLDDISDEDLPEFLKNANVFSRVAPEHKLRIVKAFQAAGEVTAMIGDGVNDAPALKKANIGIAMSKTGSDVSREAADLILLDDNFATIVNTVEDGRRIYANIKKAVGYVFIVHVPIALSALVGPLLGIAPASLLILPLHVILLELIIDPTCSVILEREPADPDTMSRPPRQLDERLVTLRSFAKYMLQGLVVFVGAFGAYYYMLKQDGQSAELARTVGLSVIILANFFLVHVVASGDGRLSQSLKNYLHDRVYVIITLIMVLAYAAIVYSPINTFFGLTSLSLQDLSLTIAIAFIATIWIKLWHIIKERLANRDENISSDR